MTDETMPPKPRAAIRVGVTGHRPVKDKNGAYKLAPDTIPDLAVTVGDVLGRIAAAADAVRVRHASVFGAPIPANGVNGTEVEGVVVSGLAAGADQVVAEAGLAQGYRLHAVIPFGRDEYRKDHAETGTTETFDALMDAAASRFALDGTRERAPRAYEAAGLVMLANADILIAVWNGDRAEGRGGTGEMVERAIADGMPVVLIHPATPKEAHVVWTRLHALAPETARFEDVSREPLNVLPTVVTCLLAPPDLGADHHPAPSSRRNIGRFLREITPWPRHHDSHHGTQKIPLETYLAERQQRKYSLLQRRYPRLLATFDPKKTFGERDRRSGPYVEETRKDWAPYMAACPPGSEDLCEATGKTLMPAFAFADRLAVHYSLYYRGAIVASYMLAFYAVLFALLAVWPVIGTPVKMVLVLLELVIILRILWIVVHGSSGWWHERFLEYRRLAEILRPMRVLALIGAPDPIGRPPGPHAPPQSFVPWYARAIRRTLPLPNATVDAAYLEGARCASATCTSVEGAAASEIAGQIAYHRGNIARMETLDHKLHRWGERLFKTTFYIGIVFIIAAAVVFLTGDAGFYEFKYKAGGYRHIDVLGAFGITFQHGAYYLKYFTTFSMALLPALGAALSAIRFQCDFGSSAHRSRRTLAVLTDLHRAIAPERSAQASVEDESEPEREETFALLSDRIVKSVDAMQVDLAEWHALSRTRGISLPA